MDGAESEILIYVKNMVNITNITVTGRTAKGEKEAKVYLERASQPEKV